MKGCIVSGYNDNFTAIACDESQMKGLLKLMDH